MRFLLMGFFLLFLIKIRQGLLGMSNLVYRPSVLDKSLGALWESSGEGRMHVQKLWINRTCSGLDSLPHTVARLGDLRRRVRQTKGTYA